MPRVVVGLSGGVDSSVSAKLLVDQGHEVIGIFLKNWDDNDPQCPAGADALDARKIAEHLGIDFYSFDFSKEYREYVFHDFLESHKAGATPNPDIWCNQFIKFKVFLEQAERLKADFLATGHYARNTFNEKTKLHELQIPKDKAKDQTYFLYTLGQKELAKVLFPLQDLTKSQVRELARKEGFHNAEKKDSVGICFVGERNYFDFLNQYLEKNPGDIVEADTGKVLGRHEGLAFYTIGQRKNLHVGGVQGFPEAPWFTVAKDFTNNQLLVSQDEQKLEGSHLQAHKLHWVAGKPPAKTFACQARIRYRSEAVPCSGEVSKSTADDPVVCVRFKESVRAITPGQSIVFYDENVCLGGGEILSLT